MKKLFLSVLFLLGSCAAASAQEASITTPVPRSAEAKYTVTEMLLQQNGASVETSVKDAANVEIRRERFFIPDVAHPAANINGLMTAMDTIRSGETGGILRKMNFRVLGYLGDNGYLPGTTVVP